MQQSALGTATSFRFVAAVCGWTVAILVSGGGLLPPVGAAAESDAGGAAAVPVEFARDVQPLLARRCYACHGPDTQEAGLRLDDRTTATAELDSGATAIVPGSIAASEILARITAVDPEIRMPPEGPRLSADEIATLTAWIEAGAEWQTHWAFRRVERPPVPGGSGAGNPIDAFIAAGLAARGLPRGPEADRATLLRRATYSVTGLPPTEEAVAAFLADTTAEAWEKVVDRLLASPHYGEHWARHWLDLVRYAETNSFERDGAKPHAWRYRDYVIRSLNDDKPYDRFVIEQLAGDELPDPDADALIATGYYRLGLWDDEPADKLQARYDGLDDIVSTTGQVFLGLTINCARCHDHKIDPLPQRDYYAMLAFFHNVTPLGDRQMNPALIERPLPTAAATLAEVEETALELDRRRAEATSNIDAINRRIKEHGEQALDDLARADLKRWKKLLAELDRERADQPRALVVTEHGPKAPETFVFYRGNPHAEPRPENLVEPAFPGILEPPAPEISPPASGRSTGRRTALAQWITSPDNPLTARVMANRIWQYHFGRGIVRSPNNFGLMGDPPTHPELLDWLAAELVAGGWRLKSLHKTILMSRAFRTSSEAVPEALARDPLNDACWRFDMRRLAAEEIRDSIHVASGTFNPKMFGPSVYPAMPPAVLATQSQPGKGWGSSSPEEQARRSIYIHVKRSLLMPLLADYDLADPDASCPVRFTTTQPTQALGMMNGEFLHAQARAFAERVRREAGGTNADQTAAMVRRALEVALVRTASDVEVAGGVALVDDLETRDGVGPGRAFELYCLMLLNLNEFAYLD
jgi:mono/diheme cytochrome c family protein